MTIFSTERIVHIAVVAAMTWATLFMTENWFGREVMWVVGLAFLLLAGFALFRSLRKKV